MASTLSLSAQSGKTTSLDLTAISTAKTVTFPNYNYDLANPLVSTVQYQDSGSAFKNIVQSGTGLPSNITTVLPNTIGALENVQTITNVGGSTLTMSYKPFVPTNELNLSGFSSWSNGSAAPFWTYTRPNFVVVNGGYGYCNGQRVDWVGGQSVAVVANSKNYIYIDTSGILSRDATGALPFQNIMLFEVLDDGVMVNVFVKKENHPVDFCSTISGFIHNSLGNIIRGPGAVIGVVLPGTGAAITNKQLKITGDDIVEDHGLTTNITTSALLTMSYWYLNNAGKWFLYSTDTEIPHVGANLFALAYNPVGSDVPLALTTGRRAVYRIYVTEDSMNTSAPQYFAVMGRVEYTTLANANTAISNGVTQAQTNELLAMEGCHLGQIVIRANGTYGYIEQVTIEKNQWGTQFSGGAASGSHLLLADTDGGQFLMGGHQYTAQRYESTIDATNNQYFDSSPAFRNGAIWNNTVYKSAQLCTYSITGAATAVWPNIILSGPGNNTGRYPSYGTKTDTTAIGVNAGPSLANSGVALAGGTYCGYGAGLAITTGTYNTFVGHGAGDTVTTGGSNVCIGYNSDCIAGATSSIALGDGAVCSTNYAVAIGLGAVANTIGAIAIGGYAGGVTYRAESTGAQSIAIGAASLSSGASSIAIGGSSTASKGGQATANYAISMGYDSSASTTASIAIGQNANAGTNADSLAMCRNSIASGAFGVAIGVGTEASAQGAVAIGIYCNATGTGSVALGGISTGPAYGATASNSYAFAVGSEAVASAIDSIAIGRGATANAQDGVAIGRGAAAGLNQFVIGPGCTDCRYADAGGGWVAASDETLKRDIVDLNDDCLTFIQSLKVKEFSMNVAPNMRQYGFVAQDIHSLLTDKERKSHGIVTKDENDGKMYLRIQQIFVKHVKATQQLLKRVEDLEKQLKNI